MSTTYEQRNSENTIYVSSHVIIKIKYTNVCLQEKGQSEVDLSKIIFY